MSGLEGAACRGRWWLFDSTSAADHELAVKSCATCPAIDACRVHLAAEIERTKFSRSAAPRGTWAGELLTKSGIVTPLPREHGAEVAS